LRIGLGVIFVAHGVQKLFGWFGGSGLESTASFLVSYGVTPGAFWAVVGGLGELAGGIALLVGFLTRWAAIGLAVRTVVALLLVNASGGFQAAQGGGEFPLALLAGLLTLTCTGAQHFALDAQIRALDTVSPAMEPSVRKAA
jgi:putative oxidoreductase